VLFYLGTHEVTWLAQTMVPLFLSRRRLSRRRYLPRALGPWALDSGGFSELSLHGAWQTTTRDYVAEVRRWSEEIGGLAWSAIQDWMCEPFILRKTGRTVAQHQERTLNSYAELLDQAPELPWTPVLQGWAVDDYRRHVEAYVARDLPLFDRVVGLGSVCRRQGMSTAREIVRRIARLGIRLHGFGFKVTGLIPCAGLLESADSLAWSFDARYAGRQSACTHRTCANCLRFALRWREDLLRACTADPLQGALALA
jgi:hypothetical protein